MATQLTGHSDPDSNSIAIALLRNFVAKFS